MTALDLAYIELVRSDRALEAAMRFPLLPPEIRDQLELQRARIQTAIAQRVGPCGHPLPLATLAGLWDAESDVTGLVTAEVTCGAPGCGTSMRIPLRRDYEARVHGGDLADSIDPLQKAG